MYDCSFLYYHLNVMYVRSVLHHLSDIMDYRKNFSYKRDSQIIIKRTLDVTVSPT